MKIKLLTLAIVGAVLLSGCSKKDTEVNDNGISSSKESTIPENQGTLDQGSQPTKSTTMEYSSEEVTKHNNKMDCWTVINGKVYDLTFWIDQHPGGQSPIAALCGNDGSAMFNMQHNVQEGPNSMLTQYQIGIIKKA
jgi:cytochrome b involved in lipid metabolism